MFIHFSAHMFGLQFLPQMLSFILKIYLSYISLYIKKRSLKLRHKPWFVFLSIFCWHLCVYKCLIIFKVLFSIPCLFSISGWLFACPTFRVFDDIFFCSYFMNRLPLFNNWHILVHLVATAVIIPLLIMYLSC